jgi:hypothetical protein
VCYDEYNHQAWCLTGAEAAASKGVLLPSTRALGRGPLTGEVGEPRWKERAPVAQVGHPSEQCAKEQPRCEIGKIREAEGGCPRRGEVQFDGSVLCVRHAELLGLEDQSERVLGDVFKMDRWLESDDGQADESRVRRAEHHRNELAEQIRLYRARIGLIRDELLKDHE